MRFEHKILGRVVETKDMQIDGVDYGVVSGYIATWEPDAWPGIYGVKDRIMPGAYTESIQNHRDRGNRQVRLKDQHYKTIGGFPIDNVKQDGIGLYGQGNINLNTQLGREAYALAKQGVLVDFSVGHIVMQEELKGGFRNILKADLIEGSIVDEPANQKANILEVKSSVGSELPLLDDANYKWDPIAALDRVLELKYSGGQSNAFISGILIADVIDGKLHAIPEAIKIAADEVKSDQEQLIVERYFARMGVKSPFEKKMFYTLDDIKSLSNAEMKEILLSSGMFSNGAARAVVAKMSGTNAPIESASALAEEIRAFAKSLTNK